jgi:DNA-nicking Smr family endonuclease
MVKKIKKHGLDEHLFQRAMDGVVPLNTPPTTDSKAPRTPMRKHRPETVASDPSPSFPPSVADQSQIDADDATHRKNGVQKRIIQKLKRGRFPVGDQLDLHHMTMKTAHKTLLEFIANAQNRSIECVRIIHGKGLRSENGPRLRTMARQVLRDHPRVLAFSVCKPADGGSGAMDVLLKSR